LRVRNQGLGPAKSKLFATCRTAPPKVEGRNTTGWSRNEIDGVGTKTN
jgi:hypothetical protein